MSAAVLKVKYSFLLKSFQYNNLASAGLVMLTFLSWGGEGGGTYS